MVVAEIECATGNDDSVCVDGGSAVGTEAAGLVAGGETGVVVEVETGAEVKAETEPDIRVSVWLVIVDGETTSDEQVSTSVYVKVNDTVSVASKVPL